MFLYKNCTFLQILTFLHIMTSIAHLSSANRLPVVFLIMINEDGIVYGGPELDLPKSLSYGKYVTDQLKGHCINNRNKIALIDASTNEELSYHQILSKIIYIANGLKKMNIGRGDVVAICSENCGEYITIGVAAICVGAAISKFSAKHTKAHPLGSSVEVIEHHAEFLHRLCHDYDVVGKSKVSDVFAVDIDAKSLPFQELEESKDRSSKIVFCSKFAIETKLQIFQNVPCIQHIVQMNGDVKEPGVLSLDDITIEEGNVLDYEPEAVDAKEDVAFVSYATGTKGVPKGVMLTHRNVVYGSQVFDFSKKYQHYVLATPPFHHLYAFLVNVQFILDGDLLVYMSEFNFDTFLTAVGKYQITKLLTGPKILGDLSRSDIVGKYELSYVQEIWLATIPVCPAPILIGAKQKFPNCKGIFQAYGLTQTSSVVFKESENHDETLVKEGSCGAPLPGIIAKVVGNTGENLKAYQSGEIRVKSPTTMKEFVENAEATRDIYDQEGFLKTGDIGYYDANGCFYVTDIVEEVMICKGQQVFPWEVESVLMQHGGVQACGVVGARHAVHGELPTAFVVTKPGVTLTEGQLLHYANVRLPPCSQLDGGIIFVEEIPKSESGQILRRVLRNQLRDYNWNK